MGNKTIAGLTDYALEKCGYNKEKILKSVDNCILAMGDLTITEYIGFDIKVPVKDDFSSMTKILGDFNKITQRAPFLNKVDATIRYKQVDLGSTWIEFFIAGTAAIALLNSLSVFIDHCIAIVSHKKTCQQQEENLRRMEIANDSIEAVCKANQDVTKALKDKCLRLEGSNFRLGGIAPITRAVPSFRVPMRLDISATWQKGN